VHETQDKLYESVEVSLSIS